MKGPIGPQDHDMKGSRTTIWRALVKEHKHAHTHTRTHTQTHEHNTLTHTPHNTSIHKHTTGCIYFPNNVLDSSRMLTRAIGKERRGQRGSYQNHCAFIIVKKVDQTQQPNMGSLRTIFLSPFLALPADRCIAARRGGRTWAGYSYKKANEI